MLFGFISQFKENFDDILNIKMFKLLNEINIIWINIYLNKAKSFKIIKTFQRTFSIDQNWY
jgi:hypothetical protein